MRTTDYGMNTPHTRAVRSWCNSWFRSATNDNLTCRWCSKVPWSRRRAPRDRTWRGTSASQTVTEASQPICDTVFRSIRAGQRLHRTDTARTVNWLLLFLHAVSLRLPFPLIASCASTSVATCGCKMGISNPSGLVHTSIPPSYPPGSGGERCNQNEPNLHSMRCSPIHPAAALRLVAIVPPGRRSQTPRDQPGSFQSTRLCPLQPHHEPLPSCPHHPQRQMMMMDPPIRRPLLVHRMAA